ncbi:phage tail tape measure protein, partial [Streptococcus pneumoniae]|nr:phage tail tape measure protein [Streptococcus pneumoniae]
YGISTASINEGMQEIIKKGFDANQTIEAMPAILDAAKASGEDFNTVMNATTNILQQFGLSTQDTERVTNSLTFVANKTAAGFADMGAAMEYVGPVAKNVGMDLEETAATVGLLSN